VNAIRVGSIVRLVLGVGALAALAACSRSIGDNCTTNIDCSANGDRTCDLSEPGGYCTIDGCDATSCPDESVCVRFFPEQYLTKPCDPACEDVATPDCQGGQVKDLCLASELCLDEGLCAPRAVERRLCEKTCGNSGDCRGGYECRSASAHGSMPLLADPKGTANFCAPLPS
jgi:hypothetical protein